jgi:hypothetical protein
MDPTSQASDLAWYVEWFWRSVGIAAATVFAFFGYLWRAVSKSVQRTDSDISEIRKLITDLAQKLAEQQLTAAQHFVTREELLTREDRSTKAIMDRLDNLEAKLWSRNGGPYK